MGIYINDKLLMLLLFGYEVDGKHRLVNPWRDPEEPNERKMIGHGTPQGSVVSCIRVVALPFVAKHAIRTNFVFIGPFLPGPSKGSGDRQRRVESSRLPDAPLSALEWNSLILEMEIFKVKIVDGLLTVICAGSQPFLRCLPNSLIPRRRFTDQEADHIDFGDLEGTVNSTTRL
ncbi:hypothetical protein StoSoilB20_11950 [Arthrobacter sp. StoSoilB20]|nr:hypothetical protein StoSoilB20_11950 [Arthrobacter sp. StoSoilB20]